ncbi:glycosyltransferase [Bacillus sp. SIMBA_074]|uniref:glycosyltransferase family 32 protein n=2 Tax=Bacillales TaxID=1385 RepID=UPI00397E5F3F
MGHNEMNKIPKVIHYCWFGKNKKSEFIEKCIESWEKHLPDYEFVEWNEENFDINCNQFVKEAYEEKKWAFVSDYVRLWALYHYGGIYLDTDVEVLKGFDAFLGHDSFSGFEDDITIPTGIIGAMKNSQAINMFLKYYDNRSFYLENGDLDTTTNVEIITEICSDQGFEANGSYQILNNGMHIYPKEYFCPKEYKTGILKVTKNTYCIHHFNGSWITKDKKFKKEIRLFMFRILGERTTNFLLNIVKR